jgi:hypothetical protein
MALQEQERFGTAQLSEVVATRITPQLRASLEARARRQRRTVANLTRIILEDALLNEWDDDDDE